MQKIGRGGHIKVCIFLSFSLFSRTYLIALGVLPIYYVLVCHFGNSWGILVLGEELGKTAPGNKFHNRRRWTWDENGFEISDLRAKLENMLDIQQRTVIKPNKTEQCRTTKTERFTLSVADQD